MVDLNALASEVAQWSPVESSIQSFTCVGACGMDYGWVFNGGPKAEVAARGRDGQLLVNADLYPLNFCVAHPMLDSDYVLGYEISDVDVGEDMDLRSSDDARFWYVRSAQLHPELYGDTYLSWPADFRHELLLSLGLIQVHYRWLPTRADCVSTIRVAGRVLLPDGTERDNDGGVALARALVRGLEESIVVNPWFVAMDEDEHDYDGEFYK